MFRMEAYIRIGPKPYLDRLAHEYGLTTAELLPRTRSRRASSVIDGTVYEVEYLVHESMLRPHGEFPCAGDTEAFQFCEKIADAIVVKFGMSREVAVTAINRHWPGRERTGRPRIWIVGLDTAYHQTPDYWATRIFPHHQPRWAS
jgi:hypothetical protein